MLEDGSGGGDVLTLADLNCMDGEVAVSNGTGWSCGSPEVSVVDPVISDLLARIAALEKKVVYGIGDTGPGGGIVFKTSHGGTSGLEVAPVDQTSAVACNLDTDIPGVMNLAFSDRAQDPNSGAYNTRQIRAVCGDDSAAGVAATYVWPEGRMDGYLPSTTEFVLLESQREFLDGFLNGTYWSSSQSEFEEMWVAFLRGNDSFNIDESVDQARTRQVRTIRSF